MAAAETGEIVDWRELRPGLVRYLTRRTGCRSAAEDLAQDLWVRMDAAWRGAGEVRNPAAYLFRAAANLAADHARAEKRRAALNAEAMALLTEGLDLTPSPEQAAADFQEYAQVCSLIAALPPRTCEIFMLNRFEGVSYRKIAVQLGISTTAVEKHMKRALDALAGVRHPELKIAASDEVGQSALANVIE